MMTPKKEDLQRSIECCMCGDFGLPSELFQCKICQFRSQHSYCSNVYPKAESYQECNWCLSQKDDTKERSQNSSNSNSSNKTNSGGGGGGGDDNIIHHSNKNSKRSKSSNHGTSLQLLQVMNKPIKKQKSPERSRSPSTRKRVITNGALEEEKLRRRRSSEDENKKMLTSKSNNNRLAKITTSTTAKPVFFRNKNQWRVFLAWIFVLRFVNTDFSPLRFLQGQKNVTKIQFGRENLIINGESVNSIFGCTSLSWCKAPYL
ncbi:hypothetical protein Ddye_006403 [Dipteronia dyeriana]|uniref:PHD-type zinc finger plants domain-containing protein n=1 Tax=Dipteronia dyeriana TaxID=168575 RepID=A0AAD9XIC0_9ROSI|nr:hypothetical protein Ddye_006403 [Dipteronia dyeriana]